MSLLITNWSRMFASRSKTLLKRRKIALKKRPVSKKQLKDEAKKMNYAYEYRILQLQKQLDKRNYPNRHIDELMQEIFYPDIAFADQEALSISLQIKKQNIQLTNATHLQSLHEQQENQNSEKLSQISEINSEIQSMTLPEDILNFYLEYKKNFGNSNFHLLNYEAVFQQIRRYFSDRYRIMQRLTRDWDRKMMTMKKKDVKFQVKSCPYEFYDHEDIYRVEGWNLLVNDFKRKIQQFNEHQIMDAISIAVNLSKALGSIPSQIYEALTRKIIELPIDQYEFDEKVMILNLINLRKKQKYPDYQQIQSIETSAELQKQLKKVGNKLCDDVIGTPECSLIQLESVMMCYQNGVANFRDQQSEMIKKVVMNNLSEIKVEKVINYLDLYLRNSVELDSQLIMLLKFDIYRKLPNIQSKVQIAKCMNLIRGGKFISNPHFQSLTREKRNIEAMDLFTKLAQTLSFKYCGTGQLQANRVRTIIWNYFVNNLRDINLLQLIANELVKNKEEISLERLTESVFLLNLLGYQSPMLAQVLYQEFIGRYQETRYKYKKNQKLMLPQNQTEEVKKKVEKGAISDQERLLEESLIFSIWMLLNATKNTNQETKKAAIKVKIDNLLKLYPKKIHSTHVLIGELCKNIYEIVRHYKLFWPIQQKSLFFDNYIEMRDTIHKDPYAKFYGVDIDIVSQAMRAEAGESEQFVYNYNFIEKRYLPEIWSSVNTYSCQEYVQWVAKNRNNTEQRMRNYFNTNKQVSTSILDLRRQVCRQYDIIKANKNSVQQQKTKGQEAEYDYYKLD